MSKSTIYKTENAKKEYQFVGKNVPFKNVREKVTGEAKYSIDIIRPGAYVAKLLECPHPHARVKSINISAAEELPGVAAILSANDVPDIKVNPAGLHYAARSAEAAAHDSVSDMRAIPRVTHYKGEAVVAVAAKTEEIALKALDLIEIEYEVLPFVTNVFDAMKEDAPLVHEGMGSNISMNYDSFPGNRGDIDASLNRAAYTVEGELLSSRQHTMPLEPTSCTAEFDIEGNLTVWVPHQRTFILRRQIAGLLNMPEASVNIICGHAGGFFGEANFAIVPFTVFLAKKAGRPVRMEFTREQMTKHVPCRELYYMKGKLGFDEEGHLLVATKDMIVDSGAYFNRSANIIPPILGAISGQYALPAFRGISTIVYTHTPGTSGIRGYGPPSGMTLLNHLMDLGAEKMGIGRLEIRARNYKKTTATKIPSVNEKTGVEHELVHPASIGLGLETQKDVLRVAAEQFGWSEKSNRNKVDGKFRRGIGVADYTDVSGPQPHEMNDRQCIMTLEEDGSVTVIVGHNDGGQNLLGTAAQFAAEASGLRYEDFRFIHSETKGTLYDIGLGGNSGNFGMGHLFIRAGEMLKEAILKKASTFMDAPADCLDIFDGMVFVKANPSAAMSVKQIAYSSIVVQKGASEHISITARYSAFNGPLAVGVVMADVRVDMETGDILVDKLQMVHDCGRAINPMGVEGQLQGGGMMGYGYVLYEDLSISEDGAVRGNNFNTYKLPSALDIPDLDVIIYEDPNPEGPMGAKGIGQSGTIGIGGAISSAIYDATGIWMDTMPFTPEKMLVAIKEKGGR